MDDRELDMWGPGIVLQPDNFGRQGENTPDGGDRFAERQDAVHRLNIGLAGADTEANELLSIVPTPADRDFSAEMEKLFRKRSSETLKHLRHPADRGEAIQDFEELMRRYMGRAWEMSLDSRVRSRAAGAEQALGRIRAAAVADPDGLYVRLADADMLLGRMVETGVDAHAAATRAQQFRGEVTAAVLDDLAERDPQGAVARLDNGLFDGVLGTDEKMPVRSDFIRLAEADDHARQRRTEIAKREAGFETAARRRSTVGALLAALQSGEADDGHIARAFYRGEIDQEDMDELQTRLRVFDEERERQGVEIDHLDTAAKSGLAMESRGFWSQDVVDAWWAGERQRGTASAELLAGCYAAAGHLPHPYLDDIRARILSGVPDDAINAAQEFRLLRARSEPTAEAIIAALPEDEARTLSISADYAHLALPPDRIGELVEARLAETPIAGSDEQDIASVPMTPDMLAPTLEPIDGKAWLKILDFDANGPNEVSNALMDISREDRPKLWSLRDEALGAAAKAQDEHGLDDWQKDAFRHAYLSYKLVETFGSDMAKTIGDAHERRSLQMMKTGIPNLGGERLMDLYNNYVGRALFGEESKYAEWKSPEEIVMEALRGGRLQPAPFKVIGEPRRNGP